MKLRSIRWRLVASYMLLALLTAGLVGALAISLVKRYTDQQEIDYLTSNANAAARQALPLMWPAANLYQLQQLAQTAAFLGNVRVRIQDEAHNVIADSGAKNGPDTFVMVLPPDAGNAPDSNPSMMSILLGHRRITRGQDPALGQLPPGTRYMLVERDDGPWGRRFVFQAVSNTPPSAGAGGGNLAAGDTTARSSRTIIVPVGDATRTIGYVTLSGAPDFGAETIAATARAILVAALAASLVAGIVALFVGRGLTAPLNKLALTASRMSAGDLTVRAHIHSNDETGQLAQQFNQMAERLQSSFAEIETERDTLRRFITDASHELRTPITALKTFNELLRNGAADDTNVRGEFLTESQTQIERLEWITQNLLDLSRLDSGFANLEVATHDAGEMLLAAAGAFRQGALDRGIALHVQTPEPPLAVRCDRARMEIALSNLFDNALKYTPAGGHISVGAASGNAAGTVTLWVENSGAGIDPADLPHIFERFYRGKGDGAHGSGLGLALVKSVVQAHGGQVEVQNDPGQGCRFVIDLPAAAG